MKTTNISHCLKALLSVILIAYSSITSSQIARYPMQSPTDVANILDTVIAKRMERYHIPGFAVAIVKDGKLFFSKGYGYANLDNKTPVDAEKTIFRIGSITKLFTVTAMMQLVDEGKIKLDEDINLHLDNKLSYKNNLPITLHHLLSHSEGFREIPGRRTSSADRILPLKVFLKDRLIQDHYAGELATYGTYGIALSGLLLENISGLPYKEYLQKKLFNPLEMTHTNATDISEENKKDFATGYEYNKGKYKEMAFEYYHTYPASDINSTAFEMANFMIMHLNNGRFNQTVVLQRQSAIKMKSTQFRNHPQLVGYGYGFFESTIDGTKALVHGGGMDGYASVMYLFPEKNMGVFFIANREAHDFLNSIVNNFLYYFFPEPSARADHPDPSLKTGLERFIGTYERGFAPPVNISLNPDSTLSFWGGKWMQIQALLFRVINGVLDTGEDLIAFKENENGEIIWMTSGPFVYENLNPTKSKINFTKKELDNLTGTYALYNNTSFKITRIKNNLVVSVNNAEATELIARSKTAFFSRQYNATITFSGTDSVELNLNDKIYTVKKRSDN